MPQSKPMENTVESKFVPTQEHTETPFISTQLVDKIISDNSLESKNESKNGPTIENTQIPIVPVLGEMENNMPFIEKKTRKRIKIQKNKTNNNKKTNKRKRCKKGSRRNKKTHHCRKIKKRVKNV